MATYIGSKRVGSVSDYNKLSTSEKIIASKSPEITKILTGQETTSEKITRQKNTKYVKTEKDVQAFVEKQQEENYKIMANLEKNMLETWNKKYTEVGANFNSQGVQTQQSATIRRKELGLAQPQNENNNALLWIVGGIALLGALK